MKELSEQILLKMKPELNEIIEKGFSEFLKKTGEKISKSEYIRQILNKECSLTISDAEFQNIYNMSFDEECLFHMFMSEYFRNKVYRISYGKIQGWDDIFDKFLAQDIIEENDNGFFRLSESGKLMCRLYKYRRGIFMVPHNFYFKLLNYGDLLPSNGNNDFTRAFEIDINGIHHKSILFCISRAKLVDKEIYTQNEADIFYQKMIDFEWRKLGRLILNMSDIKIPGMIFTGGTSNSLSLKNIIIYNKYPKICFTQ